MEFLCSHSPVYAKHIAIVELSMILLTLCLLIHREEHHKGKSDIPETRTGEEGTAKRNIQRKHDHDPNRKPKPQHGGAGGKGKWNEIDDGSLP